MVPFASVITAGAASTPTAMYEALRLKLLNSKTTPSTSVADPIVFTNACVCAGETSLYYALRGKCDVNIVKFLIEQGIDPNIQTNRGAQNNE